MKIAWKLALSQLSMLLFFVSGMVLFFLLVGKSQIESIEREKSLDNLEQVKSRLTNEVTRMSLSAVDWGEWDDAYYFVQHVNSDFIESNFNGDLLEKMQVDFIVFFNAKGVLVYKKTGEQGSAIDADRFLEHDYWQYGDGLLNTALGPVMIASSAILTTEGEGPEQGRIYFGRFLDDNFLAAVQRDLGYEVDVSIEKRPQVLSRSVEFISSTSSLVVGHMSLINSNEEALEITLKKDRPFYQLAMRISLILLFATGVLVLCSCLVALLLQRKWILSPILKLRDQSIDFANDRNPDVFYTDKKHDEFGQLTASFRRMAMQLSETWTQLEQDNNVLEIASETDPLTQLKNRRFLKNFLDNFENWDNHQNWLCILVDIDHFKTINDTYGHDVGDIVIQQFAGLLVESSRDEDIIVRMGGEEFFLLCYISDISVAPAVCERIRKKVSDYDFGNADNPIHVTCCLGFFCALGFTPEKVVEHWSVLLKMADVALYAAKNSGRNCWVGLVNGGEDDFLEAINDGADTLSLVDSQAAEAFTSLPSTDNINWY